jgi:hypothetical protein
LSYYKPPTSSGTHYLTLQEAVALGYGAYSTLRRYIADDRLPAVKIGRRIKVLRVDLDALAAPKRSAPFEDREAAIERITGTAPRLTADQVRRLAARLGGAS